MKDSISYIIACLLMFVFGVICMFAVYQVFLKDSSTHEVITSTQFGGDVPMKIYTVYDRDTGVYYAITEKGGICVMETYNGETKLVDQGDGATIHPNLGENKNAA